MHNLGILVMRPQPLAAPTIAAFTQKGAKVWHMPTLKIHFLSDSAIVKQAIQQLPRDSWQIFVSQNAVQAVLPRMLETWSMLDLMQRHFAAVGPSTASALSGFIHADIIYPEHDLGGAALLEKLENKIQPKQKVFIWCGNESMQVLAQGLSAHKIDVVQIICYERERSAENLTAIQQAFYTGKIDYMLIHSGASLTQLMSLLPLDELNRCQMVVISERLRTLAHSLGFTGNIIVAQGADDISMINAIEGSHQ